MSSIIYIIIYIIVWFNIELVNSMPRKDIEYKEKIFRKKWLSDIFQNLL